LTTFSLDASFGTILLVLHDGKDNATLVLSRLVARIDDRGVNARKHVMNCWVQVRAVSWLRGKEYSKSNCPGSHLAHKPAHVVIEAIVGAKR
jgi:hypothetical protein